MFRKLSVPLLVLPILIYSLSFITILSISANLVPNHLLFFGIGLIFYLLFLFLDPVYLKYYSKFIYPACVVLLLVTYLLGVTKFGAVRWLNIGLFTFQPSEIAKIVLILTFASYVSFKQKAVESFKDFVVICLMVILLTLLVFLQPDLGTSIVILFTFLILYLGSFFNKYYLLIAILLVGVFSAPMWNLLKDYQKERVLIFLGNI